MEKCELLFESAKRSEIVLTLVMFDIDYFKKYNDRYGHIEGDQVLKTIGKLLKKSFKRKTDAIGRYGGEEFLAVLSQTDLETAISLVKEFQQKLKNCNLQHKDSPFGEITVSAGIHSGKISKDENLDTFLRKVDEELYKAKKCGRNRYSFYKNDSEESLHACDLN
jgi:diguanylate cyclase (GGDEF)-like protein